MPQRDGGSHDGAQFNGWKPITTAVILKKGVNALPVKRHGGNVASRFTDLADLKFSPRPPEGYNLARKGPVKMEYPSVHLSNGLIEAIVLLPDPKRGYYRGPRFDWSGMIWQVKYKDHTYFGEWKKPHDPEDVEGGISTAEEFGMGISGMPAPLGYNEAAPGEYFIKIGVGLLEKIAEPHYRFGYPYKIIKPGDWKIENGKDWIEFQQELKSKTGYGYFYTKRITLLKNRPEFIISRSLKNIGSKPINTTHYSHNFVIIDDTPIGPNYRVELPFEPKAKRDLKGIAEIKGNEIVFNRNLKKGEALFSELSGFKGTVEENGVIITNKKTGAGMRIKGDLPVLEFNFFAVRTAVCPEPFVDLTVLPGEKEEWKTSYTFFIRN